MENKNDSKFYYWFGIIVGFMCGTVFGMKLMLLLIKYL